VLAVVSLLKEPADLRDLAASSGAIPSSIPVATPTPSPALSPAAPTFRPKVDGAFRFLERVGGAPVRWDPCETITYAVNAAGATSPVRPDLREALRRVTRATGIQFRSVGTTRETFIRAYQRMRYEGVIRKAELILIWVDHDSYLGILERLNDPRPSIAFAKTMAGLFAHQDQYFGGIVVMDAGATATQGFGYRYAHGSVLLHELGHIMGLDHVRDPDQLMYSGRHPNFSVRTFGRGDLEGLRRLGTDAGCLD
jgi:matrixin